LTLSKRDVHQGKAKAAGIGRPSGLCSTPVFAGVIKYRSAASNRSFKLRKANSKLLCQEKTKGLAEPNTQTLKSYAAAEPVEKNMALQKEVLVTIWGME